MSINKFMQNSDGRPFHSSAYARVAYGDSLGSTNLQSFEKRTHIDKNRQVVGQYADSKIVHAGNKEIKTASTSALPTDIGGAQTPRSRIRINPRDRRAASPRSSSQPQLPANNSGYSSPPLRGYDPFG